MKIERRAWLPVLALVLLGLALTLPRLGASGLWDPWEPKYAQTAREMAERGDWIVPHYREDPRLNRPPMTYWLIGLSHRVFGVTETAARLPSAILAVLCSAALALAFAVRGRRWEGFLCGAALLTAPQWLLLGRFATPAMPLAAMLGLLLALSLGMPAVKGPGGRRVLRLIAVLLLVGAALTDWPRGLVLPAWAVLGWAALDRRWVGAASLVAVAALYHAGQLSYSPWLNIASFVLAAILALAFLAQNGVPIRELLAGTAFVALLVAPWFIAVLRIEPGEVSLFEYKYLLNLGESPGDHTGPYDYVLRIVAIGGLPWAAAALAGLARAVGRERDEMARILAGALLGTLAFFTLSEARMGHFYAVIQPAVAGLAGLGTLWIVRRRDWTAAPPLAALLLIWLLVRDGPSRILETATVKRGLYGLDLEWIATAVIALWAVALFAAWLRRREAWTAACLVPSVLFAGALGLWLVPRLEAKKSLRPMWERYVAERREGEPIGAYGKAKDSGFYYSNNGIVRLYRTRELEDFLSGAGSKYLIVPRSTLKKLETPEITGRGSWERLEQSHPSHRLVRYVPVGDGDRSPSESSTRAAR